MLLLEKSMLVKYESSFSAMMRIISQSDDVIEASVFGFAVLVIDM